MATAPPPEDVSVEDCDSSRKAALEKDDTPCQWKLLREKLRSVGIYNSPTIYSKLSIEALISREVIESTLRCCCCEKHAQLSAQSDDLVELLFNEYRRVFGLLVETDQLYLADFFVAKGWTDRILQTSRLSKEELHEALDYLGANWPNEDWEYRSILQNLEFDQHGFFLQDIHPGFNKTTSELPFIYGARIDDGKRGTRKIEIIPGYWKFPIPEATQLALRNGSTAQLVSYGDVELMKSLSFTGDYGFNHPSIIFPYATLIGSGIQGKEYSYIIPVINVSLADLMQRPRPDAVNLPFIIEQLTGLLDATAQMHSRIDDDASYMDKNGFYLNPIASEIVILADNTWALSACHVRHGLGFLFGQPMGVRDEINKRYSPPEGKNLSKAHDVWTFGCTIFEVLMWYFKGPGGLEQFWKDLKSGGTFESHTFVEMSGRLKKSVETFLEELRVTEAKGLAVILGCILRVGRDLRPSAEKVAQLVRKQRVSLT